MDNQSSKGASVPNGWVIKTYRHLNIPRSDFNNTKKLFDELHKEKTRESERQNGERYSNRDITYGNYDRIQLVPVNSFSDFTNESSKAFNWYGSSQSILLFPLEADKRKRSFKWGNDNGKNERVIIEDNRKKRASTQSTFLGASFCYISDEARNIIRSYEDLMKYCNTILTNLVSAYNEMIKKSDDVSDHGIVTAEAFGSLSSAELIILWSAKQYTDILYLMDCLRDSYVQYMEETGKNECDTEYVVKCSLFRTTYTMISFPDVVKEINDKGKIVEDGKGIFHNILGQAHIQFVMQDGIGEKQIKEFEKFFEQCLYNSATLIGYEEFSGLKRKLNRCAGEYDLVGYIDSKLIPRLFINPENLHGEGWALDENDKSSFFCTVHHPIYNKYVLYSFTRLSYREEDLPQIVREKEQRGEEWKETKKKITCLNLNELLSVSGEKYELRPYIKRSKLLNKIKSDYKKRFNELIILIADRVPATSNLIIELNQLFSDYVQCCCSSADYLWIEDYNELFLQVMDRVKKSVLQIEVWRKCGEERSAGPKYISEWKEARNRLDNISKLIKALYKQTSHISASTKLFFREQDIHFGYTAQHDLVLHAYYDIIKKLIGYIYSYSDHHYQSKLYPLVNFSTEDKIGSEIYTEESAMDYRNELSNSKSKDLPARIMVIHIPMDGLDNLMHYLPMLIHEVYHYASPKDRKNRNSILANIFTYQSLRFGFDYVLKKYDEKRFKTDHENANIMATEFFDLADKVFFNVINSNSNAIYAGITVDFCRIRKDLNVGDEIFIRSWFERWMKNWLSNVKAREENIYADEIHPSIYYNFCDLYLEVFSELKLAIDRKIIELEKQLKSYITDPVEEKHNLDIYRRLSNDLDASIRRMSDKDDDNSTDKLIQLVTEGAYNYVVKNDGNWKKTLEVLDEIFPDIAMVTFTKMSASAYMLQTALDLDKQLFSADQSVIEHLRFGTVISYLLKKELKDGENIDKVLEKQLELFEKMYIATYNIAVQSFGYKDIDADRRANKWSSIFRSMFLMCRSNQGLMSFKHVFKWVDELIIRMEECLTLKDPSLRDEQNRFFIQPYKKYLKLLQIDDLKLQQSKLFKLSINMIQKFQNSDTLKEINERFIEKDAVHYADGIKNVRLAPIVPYSAIYEIPISTPDAYLAAVQYALERLYRYRDMEQIANSSGMWFRGVNNIEHPVVPSGFVHYTEDASRLQSGYPNVKDPISYTTVQLHNYESFRYSAEGTSMGINPSNYYRTINYLTLMQHYRQHSNLLDWSEDYFGSTYFALEDEININDKYEHERKKASNFSTADKAAVMYVLDPVRFNIACEEIENEFGSAWKRNPGKNENGLVIPNLSIDENQKNYMEYHDIYGTKYSGKSIIRIKGHHNHPEDVGLVELKEYLDSLPESKMKEFKLELPRAIYAAKLNERIRAQSGLFVAFSLKTAPIIWEGAQVDTTKPSAKMFKYQALESIQEYYLKLTNKNPFMMVIKIPVDIKKELGRMIYKCGISKEKIYPELENYRHR